MDTVVNKIGTHCVVIDKRLVTASCPLPAGACVWKHRTTGICKYDPAIASDITVANLCERVGLPVPTEAQLSSTRDALFTMVKANLN